MRQSGVISEAELLQWERFPEFIRNDRCFSSYQMEAKNHFDEKVSLVGDKLDTDSLGSSNRSHWNTLKHLVFAFVWIIASWHLLTVKEKALTKIDMAINANSTDHGKIKITRKTASIHFRR